MKRRYYAANALLLVLLPLTTQAQTPLRFEEALELLSKQSTSIKIADKGVEIARSERSKLHALWYPSLQGTGSMVRLSQAVEARQSLAPFTNEAKDWLHTLVPGAPLVDALLDGIGTQTLVFPIAPRRLTTIDLTAQWIVFAGGKRLRAGRMGQAMVDLARGNRSQVTATQQALLAESYYGLRLATQVVSVRQEALTGLETHYQQALKLEAEGMIDRAGRLLAQVNRDEAQRELDAVRKDVTLMQSALQALLKWPAEGIAIAPTSPLFLNDSLPSRECFRQCLSSDNALLAQLSAQERLAHEQLGNDRSDYLPVVALFGKQTLYSQGFARNLVPRAMGGIGFTWNLFDGGAREKRIDQSRLLEQTAALNRTRAADDLQVAADKLYTQIEKAKESARTLSATITLSEELLRIRKRSFAEGMATSAEVIDAAILLANVRAARWTACYTYDVSLMQLLALCGIPHQFTLYN
ncbi:MAG: TolC family protein [Bacteroides sp.]